MGISEIQMANLEPGGLIRCKEDRFEAWREKLRPGGLILGLEGEFEAWKADLRSGGQT